MYLPQNLQILMALYLNTINHATLNRVVSTGVVAAGKIVVVKRVGIMALGMVSTFSGQIIDYAVGFI